MAATLLAVGVKSAAGPHSTAASIIRQMPSLKTNVSSTERSVSLALAGTVGILGFDGRGPSLLSSLASGFLAYRAATGNCPLYQVANVSTSESTAPGTAVTAGHGCRIEHAITVMKPVSEVYRFWRDFDNLPRFMAHLAEVETSPDGTSHWTARGPLGLQVEWDAELVQDTPNEVIAWKSVAGSDIATSGSVRFHTLAHDRGTTVRVNLKYDPPAGKLGTFLAKMLGPSPQRQIREDLRRFRQILEAREIPTTAGQPAGRR